MEQSAAQNAAALQPFAKEESAFYQCGHLGTLQEMTDHEGSIDTHLLAGYAD